MAAKSLDLTIMRDGAAGPRRFGLIHVTADPDDVPKLQQSLQSMLDGGKWDRKLWPQFYAEVRLAGQGRLLKTVRAT